MRPVNRLNIENGQKFNKWTVIREEDPVIYSNGKRKRLFLCRCECGKENVVRLDNIKNGRSLCCMNCKNVFRAHSMSKTEEHNIWMGIQNRCYNSKGKPHKNYGGRGISMCESWKNDFMEFYNDMGPRPSKKHSIDRIDNNGNYCKENCRWATQEEQNSNTRQNFYITHNGETKTLAQWERKTGISKTAIKYRINFKKRRLSLGS